MKQFSAPAHLVFTFIATISLLSCTKEVIKETVVTKDSIIIIKQDVAKLFQNKWQLLSHEIEQYSGTLLLNKKTENFASNGFYNEFKANGTYANVDLGGSSIGTWELLSDNYYVLDKNTSNQRYYYIISISETNFINRGPFTNTNQLLAGYLFSAYFKSAQ